jgi:hypothetical protein
MTRLARCLALLVLFPGVVAAHDFWIEPSTFRPSVGDHVTAALRVGEHLRGEAVARMPARIDRFVLKGSGAERPVEGSPGADPAGSARVSEAGPQWLAYQSVPKAITIEAPKFEAYLREEGLERIIAERATRDQSAAPGRERFHRCAKALLSAHGGTDPGDWGVITVPLGLTLELVPLTSPDAVPPGGDLPVSLLFRGSPVSGALVVAMNRDHPGDAVAVRTDMAGRASLRLARTGFWLVKAVHMEAAPPGVGVDWESWWASLTTEIPGRPGK